MTGSCAGRSSSRGVRRLRPGRRIRGDHRRPRLPVRARPGQYSGLPRGDLRRTLPHRVGGAAGGVRRRPGEASAASSGCVGSCTCDRPAGTGGGGPGPTGGGRLSPAARSPGPHRGAVSPGLTLASGATWCSPWSASTWAGCWSRTSAIPFGSSLAAMFPRFSGLGQTSLLAAWQDIEGNYVLRDVPAGLGTQAGEAALVQALDSAYHDRFSAYFTKSEYRRVHRRRQPGSQRQHRDHARGALRGGDPLPLRPEPHRARGRGRPARSAGRAGRAARRRPAGGGGRDPGGQPGLAEPADRRRLGVDRRARGYPGDPHRRARGRPAPPSR